MVAMLCDIITIMFEPVIILKYLVISPKWTDISNWALAFSCTKVIHIFLYLVTDFIVALVIVKVLHKDVVYPIPALLGVIGDLCCCCKSKARRIVRKCLQLVALWSILVFIHIVTIDVIPTLLWVFVLPVRMLSVITLTIAVVISLSIFMATLFSILPLVPPPSPILPTTNLMQTSRCCGSKGTKNKCNILLQILLIPQLITAVSFMFLLYLNLFVTTDIDTSTPTGILAPFLPTALLTIIGWLVTTGVWKNNSSTNNQTPSQRDSADVHSLQHFSGILPSEDQTNRSDSTDDDEPPVEL